MGIKQSAVAVALALSLTLGGCSNNYVRNAEGDWVPIPCNCDPLVDYQARHLNVSGIEVPIPQLETTIKVGNVVWKKDKLQEAGEAAKLLDMKRITDCRLLATRISMMSRGESLTYLDNYGASQEKLTQLALILGSNNSNAPDALAKFIDTYFKVSTARTDHTFHTISNMEGPKKLQIKDNVKKISNKELFK